VEAYLDDLHVLEGSERNWIRVPGATEAELTRLVSKAPCALPIELLELLRFSNGGEGPIGLPPLCFCLDSVDEILGSLSDDFLATQFPGYLFLGSNGGLERIALDLRSEGGPWPIVMIDPIAGPNSAEVIAPDLGSFIQAIGLEHE
jgi:hypothetical protein